MVAERPARFKFDLRSLVATVAVWEIRHRGSRANVKHDRAVRLAAKQALLYPPVVISGAQALCVANGFAKQIRRSGYIVHACAIMPEHVHLVIARHRPD